MYKVKTMFRQQFWCLATTAPSRDVASRYAAQVCEARAESTRVLDHEDRIVREYKHGRTGAVLLERSAA